MNKEVSPDGFIVMLSHLNGGATLAELEDALRDGSQAVNDFGGVAEITFKIKMQKAKGLKQAFLFSDDVNTKFPKEKRPDSFMFSTTHNGFGSACLV